MIDLRRPGQRSFGEGLIEEETANLWEPWMRHADQVLEDEQLVKPVYEALLKRHPKSRTRGRRGVAAEIVLVPLVAFLFQAPLLTHPFWLSAVLVSGTIGFAAVGTLFAAMLVRAHSRDVLLPVLLYPITVPVIIAGVRATAELLQPDVELALVRFWVALLIALDVVFVTLALWTFEPLMTD